jgi:pyruvate formate lyase activating enzyme
MSDALSLVGKEYSVEGLLDLVQRDADFYAESGGGITLSGGEPLRQHRFLAAFLPAAKEVGLHITVETCGYFPWDPVEPLLRYIDLIYFDIKVRDGDAHRAATGVDNGIILENARRLVKRGHKLTFRCPLIPGYTIGEDNLEGIIKLLQEWDQPTMHLLPYHNLGEGKLVKVDSCLQPLNLVSMSRKDAEIIGERFTVAGITPIIGGS